MENDVIKTARPWHGLAAGIFVYGLQRKFWRQVNLPSAQPRRVWTQLNTDVRITGLLIPTNRELSLKLN